MNAIFEQIDLDIKSGIYQYIGSGSGRRVYDLGIEYVVKQAKNKKGIAQNKVESKIADVDFSELFAKIPSVSPDYEMLIMEKADKVKSMAEIWSYFDVRNSREFLELKEIREISDRYDLLYADLVRRANWGKIKERYVIIDYGFTKEVKKQYY